MRNLTKGIAAISILAPASAYSLGIGDIKLHSALNQNLNAEIALLVSAGEDVSEVNVRLASPDKFDEAGVPWNYFLSKIKFDSVIKADGSMIVKLSSNEALREPYLDFLLEVSWAKGNLYREFTVLVDPPVAYTQPIIPVIKKVTLETNTEDKKAVVESIETVAEREKPIIQYGPTSAVDTLWKIAEDSNSYTDISIEQMMLAIYEANPKAFYKKNVNALMADKTLNIPEKEIIIRLSKKEALTEFKKQDNAWNGIVVATVDKVIIKDEISTQLELEAPIEEEVTEADVVTALETLSENTEEVSPVKNEEFIAAVESTAESIALLTRLEKLEADLIVMQKMLTLKDEQLAALQSQEKAQAAQIVKTEKEKEKKNNEVVASQVKTQVEKAKAVVKTEEKKAKKPELKPVIKQVVQLEPDAGFFAGSLFKIILGIVVLILGGLGWLWSRKRKVEIETDTESMFATASEMSLSDSTDDTSVSVLDDTSSYDVGTVGESSFLSEFTPSDFDAFDNDQNEVDPVSEADVYLAYGRYQQAEDLMRQAIIDQPERDECKLKLLEIFYANENKSGFEEYATELVNSGKHNDQDFWSKVVEMGAEIAPDSSLFTDQVDATANFDTAEKDENTESIANEGDGISSSKNDINDDSVAETVDFDLSVFDESSSDEKTDEDTTVNDIDLDLSVFDKEEPALENDDEISTPEETEAVDFDLESEASIDKDKEQQPVEQENETIDSLTYSEESNLDDGSIGEELVHTENKVNDDLESFDFSLENDSSGLESEGSVESTATLDDDIEGFDFDFDTGTEVEETVEAEASPAPSDALDALDMGVSDLTDMDELETKIDLAKAYIDMGDVDAARGIADEVMDKGSDEQKSAAQAIIDQLK